MDEIFVKVARHLLDRGEERRARGLLTLEVRNAWLVLEDTRRAKVTLGERGLSESYLEGELEWYKSGSLWAGDIAKHSKFWAKLADPNGTVNSNYGFLTLVEKWSGMSQLEWCKRRLSEDPDTRQAVMNYNQPRHKYEGNKDFVCTLTQKFSVREGAIDTHVHMRSNDLIYGLSYDAPWFCWLLHRLCEELEEFRPGYYLHQADTLHVYERHFDMLERIAGADIGD
jgi:thymidylate synthase